MSIENIKLVIFDVDGTLCQRDSVAIFPHMIEFLRQIGALGLSVALASNQGGVGLRYWMESAGFGEPEKYPSEQMVIDRLLAIAASIDEIIGYECCVHRSYMSFSYQSKTTGAFGPVPPCAVDLDRRWSSWWRKPNPGMLEYAISAAGTSPVRTLFVGDSDEDRQAAAAISCNFSFVGDLRAKGWLR